MDIERNARSRSVNGNGHIMVALILGCGICGCARQSNEILIIVPTGFRGPIFITENSTNGTDTKSDGDRYVFNIPSDGNLLVRSIKPILGSHPLKAEFSDKTELKMGILFDPGYQSSKDVRLFGLGAASGSHLALSAIYYVGTETDAKEFYQVGMWQPRNDPLPIQVEEVGRGYRRISGEFGTQRDKE